MEKCKDPDDLARQAAALLLCFQGSVCLYQGEELGLVDTELSFDELTDPQGINFWPEDKGRDGCRTPMVWDKKAPNAGFSTANATWLPIKAPQLAKAVSTQGKGSVLAFYRTMLALRKSEPDLITGAMRFLDLPDPLLGFDRGTGFTCIFNLSVETVSATLSDGLTVELSQGATLKGKTVKLAANGFVIARRSAG